MGQRIEVRPTIVGDTAIFDTDRSLTGQVGASYTSHGDAAADLRFPGQLATRLFEADDATQSVWVASNTVVVRRSGEWDDTAAATASTTIEDFFIFYRDDA